ncbi:MAG TPA: response regulator [Candidatus Paceibacterota bacterium]|nr:response regulator [Candidatus Paceibacterota bacterium]
MAVLFIAFVIAAAIGRTLFTMPAVIQPAAGVAFAGLVLGGIALWPAIVAASIVNSLIVGTPPIVTLTTAAAHALHAIIGAFILRSGGFDPVFRRVRDMFLFIAVALSVSTILPTLGILGIMLHNALLDPDWPMRATWISWWVGTMIGDLILASAVIRYFAKPHFTRTSKEIIELSVAFAALGLFTYLVYWVDVSSTARGIYLLLYLVSFVWFSLRLGNRFTLIAFALSSVVAVTGTLYGNVPSEAALPQRIITLEFFLATLAVIFYLFTTVVEERKRSARQLQMQLNRVNNLLEESKRQDNAKSEFIAVFAHELRNPLAPIVSSVELLKLRWGAHPEIAPIVETIEDRTRTIVRLLDDLLDVSRISRQSFKLKEEKFDVRERIEDATRAMRPLVQEHGLSLTTSMPNHPVYLFADSVRVEQIIGNLLMNAIKYTPSGGHIMLVVREDGDVAEIRVKDTGVGIPKKLLRKIFEPFSHLGAERQQHRKIRTGLGIGLWLTENLVNMHGGTITARSDGPMLGSEFVVRLPRLLEQVPGMEDSAQPDDSANPIRTGTLKVLVVDDNEAAAKGLGTLLEYSGNTVALAYGGAEAVKKSREFSPDAVVLDIGLPDVNGYEVAQMLREEGYRGKIVALTGYGQEEDKRKAREAGFDDHLTKPVGIADLQAVLVQA